MLKRCLSPLTLVNQVALIVLLSTARDGGFWLAGARRSGQRPCDQQSGIAAHAKLPSVGGSAIKRERQALN